MRIVLFLLAVLLSGSAWACPDLSGTYTCEVEEAGYVDVYDIVLSQSETNGVTTYDYGDEIKVIADGQKHSVPDDEGAKNQTYVATCQGDSLLATLTGLLQDNGATVGNFSMDLTASKTPQGDYSETLVGTLELNGQKHAINQSVVCKRK